MHNTLVFATFPLHSSVFYHSTERFVKFGAVLHHDINRSFLLKIKFFFNPYQKYFSQVRVMSLKIFNKPIYVIGKC